MNILIIGNGFDLAHELPTTYTSFLKFIEQVLRIRNFNGTATQFESKIELTGYDKFNELDESVKEYIHSKISNDEAPNAMVKETLKVKNDPILQKIISLAENNTWIKWFQNQKEICGQNWIDFEAEIYKVIQNMESIKHKTIDELTALECKIASHFELNKRTEDGFIDISECKNKMLDDLNALIRCLELYLEDCVRNIDKYLLSTDIFELNIDKVLSFNYTDTYSRIYSGKHGYIEHDYIHGKSKISTNEPNNMVLGIDEYLSEEEQLTNVEFIEFKKYFQRIHKMTGCQYKQWLDEITRSKSNKNNAYFFGHSLAKTDKDILLEILNNKKITTTIFYRNDKHYAELITNLVQLLGDNEVISRVYGANPRIIFQKQSNMIDRYNSEWEILNDCNELWEFHNLCNNEIEDLIKKIQNKIDEQDLEYFHSQSNVISLFNALTNNYPTNNTSELLNIAKKLYSDEKLETFDPNVWNNYNYLGIFPCPPETKDFISALNKFNYNKSIETKDQFEINDLNLLYTQLLQFNIGKDSAMELLNVLLKKLREDIDHHLCWECIRLLTKKFPKRKLFHLLIVGLLHQIHLKRFALNT